jgi:hypothetical protein
MRQQLAVMIFLYLKSSYKLIYFVVIIILYNSILIAQEQPKDYVTWQNNIANLENDKYPTSFNYFSGFGESESLDTSKKLAFDEIMMKIANNSGMVYDAQLETNTKAINTTINNDITTRTDFEYEAKIKGEKKKVKVNCLREVESFNVKVDGRYRYYMLVRIPKPGKENECNSNFYKSFGTEPVWRSALIPGWGQLYKYNKTSYKPDKTKGIFFLTLGAVSLTSLVTSQLMYKKYNDLAIGTNSLAARKDYNVKADDWQNMRNYAAIATVGVYVINLIEVLSSKGAKMYSKSNTPFRIVPSVTPGGYNLAFQIKLDK